MKSRPCIASLSNAAPILRRHPPTAKLKTAIDAFAKKLETLRTDHGHEAPALATIGDQLTSLATDVEGADRLPTEAQKALLAECRSRLDQTIALWSGLAWAGPRSAQYADSSPGRRPIKVPTAEQIAAGRRRRVEGPALSLTHAFLDHSIRPCPRELAMTILLLGLLVFLGIHSIAHHSPTDFVSA